MVQTDKMPALDQGAEMVHVLKSGSKATKARARKTGAPKGRKSAKTKRRIASSVTHHQAPSVADLQVQLEHRTTELDRALERQTATADILSVIASSPSDVQPVFEAIAESAARLCQAEFCNVFRFDGELIHFMHSYGYSRQAIKALRHFYPMRPGRGSCAGRAILNGKVEQVPDVRADPEYAQGNVPDIMKISSIVAVPMLKERRPVGAVALVRAAKGTFPQRQIDLLKTFADQAVIAIENTRLFNEVQAKTHDLLESLQQQTATAEVLKVISSSPGELEPVFRAMLENATRICEAEFGNLFLLEGGAFRAVAVHGEPAYVESWQREPVIVLRDHPGVPLDRLAHTNEILHIHDLTAEPAYMEGDRRMIALVDSAGARTMLLVPMLRDNAVIGAIVIYRQEVRAFTDKQIELVKNFASQAVIAFENARLLSELRESLQQQTATAEVLKTISRSTFDLPAVLHALVETAAQLCDADKGTITREKDGAFYRAESYGFSKDFMNYVRDVPVAVDRHTATGRALLEGVVIHIPDVEKDPITISARASGSAITARCSVCRCCARACRLASSRSRAPSRARLPTSRLNSP
jgi:two-component system, NtrC family, sensor kinase